MDDGMIGRSAMPLPPVRSRRAAGSGDAWPREGAPLPPYVPGRTVAVAASLDASLLPVEEASLATAEPAPIELVEEAVDAAPVEAELETTQLEPSFEPGESWVVGGEEEHAGEEETGWVVTGMGEAWESGEGYPFEAAAVEPETEETAEIEAEAEEVDAQAFPWELPAETEADAEPEAEALAELELEAEPAVEATDEPLSPWEELREAAAQSIDVPDEGGVTASLGIEAATESAGELAGEFAQRLEALAERLRLEGLRAIDRTLAEGDRLDAAVAGFLTGYLAARDE